MKNNKLVYWIHVFAIVFLFSCTKSEDKDNSYSDSSNIVYTELTFNPNQELEKCEEQLRKSTKSITDYDKHPRLIETNEAKWKIIPNHMLSWTVGFYPGILWYMYESTGDEHWKDEAIARTLPLTPFQYNDQHHDTGFMMYCSFGNGYRLTGEKEYKEILIQSAKSLASRYNPNVGTIKSWSTEQHSRWSQHITIIDNMMNLELLYWAAKNGGGDELAEIATTHAETTMKNHYREDLTSWHVLEYDSITGEVLNRHTKQGYSDDSRWSRGQAWGIYGFTLVYRETGDKKFLEFAGKIADKYIELLPEDFIPYWDFDAPNIPDEERDASAAAIVASALIELSEHYTDDEEKSIYYLNAAKKMLNSLSSTKYSGYNLTESFLVHSTGAKSLGKEIDVALIYADYYYLEALLRLQNHLEETKIQSDKITTASFER